MSPAHIKQAGAIPFRRQDGQLEYCLITSSSQPNTWTVPKGTIEPGDSAEITALKESLEEAGIEGELVGGCLGTYDYSKNGGEYEVEIFLMRVTRTLARWDESDIRKRQWVSGAEARRLLATHPVVPTLEIVLSDEASLV